MILLHVEPVASAPKQPSELDAVRAQLAAATAELKKLRIENGQLKAQVTRHKRPRKIAADYLKLGDPPDDPLEATAWVHRMLVVAARRAARDTTITEAESRAEVSRLAAQIKDLIPTTRLRQAEKIVQADNADVLSGGGPELVHAPPADSAGGTRPQARRGRPPKRSLR